MPGVIRILGSETGSERRAAEDLATLFTTIMSPTDQLTIFVGFKRIGERRQDLDLLVLGAFGRGIRFSTSAGGAASAPVRLVNLALIIEVKDQAADRIFIEGGHVKVRYRDTGWSDCCFAPKTDPGFALNIDPSR